MDNKVICGLSNIRGTPIFFLPQRGKHLKSVFGATFIREQLMWVFPAFHPFLSDVVRDLQIVEPDIEFTPEAEQHIIDCETQSDKDTEALLKEFQFVTEPFDHQKDAIVFALQNLRCGIFHDMGLGKSKVVVDLLRHYKTKALVLTPTVGLGMWIHELSVHSDNTLVVLPVKGTAKKKKEVIAKANEADVLVVGYDTAKNYHDQIFDQFDYNIIVADESHYLRGPSTARTKSAIGLASKAKRRIILSGTPSLGNPMHLYGQLSFLGKYIPAKDLWTFKRHYLIFAKGTGKRIVVGYKNLDMLNEKVQRIAVRRKKAECLDLPDRTITDVIFDPSTEQRKLYNKLVSGAIIELQNGELYEPELAAVVLQKMLQLMSGFLILPKPNICDDCFHLEGCVHNSVKPYTLACRKVQEPPPGEIQRLKSNPKLERLGELLESALENPEDKAIVWCYFREELNIVQEYLEEQDIKYIRVDGSNSSKGQEFSEKFNSDPEIRVWLAQDSTGVALTLTGAAYTIYFGLTYRLDDYLQSMDRNHRIGQNKPTFVYRLMAKNSILEFVAKALAEKQDIANTLSDKIECVFCEKSNECLSQDIEPFQKGCIHKSRVKRTITRPGKL